MDLSKPASDLASLEALMEAQLKLKTLEKPLVYPPEVTDIDPLSRYSRQNFAIFLEKIKFAMGRIIPSVSVDFRFQPCKDVPDIPDIPDIRTDFRFAEMVNKNVS